jgi:hypothetical protein
MLPNTKMTTSSKVAVMSHRVMTFAMLMMACLLWGYLIGAYLQLRTSLVEAPQMSTHQLPGILSSDAGRTLGAASEEKPLGEEQLKRMADEHTRFSYRDRSFESRLSYDSDFVLKNSF